MSLNVTYLDGDEYDTGFMRRSICPSQFKNVHAYSENHILESIIFGPNDSLENIELIARPYILDGKKVIVNECGEFEMPKHGEFMIELRPKNVEITPHEIPDEVFTCKRNHEYAIFKYTISNTYDFGEPMEVMINLFYKPSSNKLT
jgi:hypothetical protein